MVNKEFIPNGWRKVTIDDICELRRGASPRPISDPKYFGNGAGWVRISDVTRAGNYLKQTEQYLSKLGESKSVKVTPGEVIMSICATIGRPIIVDMEACIHDGFVVFKNLSEHVNNLFFLYWLKTKENYFNSLGQQGTQKNLNTNIVKKTEILLPPLPVQRKIATILSSVDEAIEKTEAIIEQTEKVKKGLMQQLLTKGIGHTKFKKTEIGEIPEEWDVLPLGNIIHSLLDFRGKTPKKLGMDWGNGNIRALSANNVKMGYIDFDEECYLGSEELYNKWMTKGDLSKGDIIFTMEAPLGNVAQVPDNQKYILSQRVIGIKPKDFVDKDFLKYYMMSPSFQNRLKLQATGTTAKGISQKNLLPLEIVVPSINEQKKITEILATVDKKLEREKVVLKELSQIKKGLMQSLLTGKVRVKVDDEVVSS